jgi:CBS domain-containing protein
MVAMDEVAGFLKTVAPFDGLDEADLGAVAAATEIESYPAGTRILVQGGDPSQSAWVVRQGAVELADEGRVIDLMGEGEMFGHRSMITGDPVSLTVSAHDDTVCYRLPEHVVRAVLSRPSSLRHLVVSVSGRYELRAREGVAEAEPTRRPVGEIVHRDVVVCQPTTTVREAAQQMVEANSSSVLVDLGDDLGIVTDSDLRTRVVAAGAGPDTTLADVMTAPARTVTADRPGSDVLLELLDSGLHHLPVVDARRNVVGVVTDSDLIGVAARSPFQVRAAITHATDAEALREAMARLPQALIALHDARVPAHTLSGVITSAHDALTRRSIELAEADLGSPPVPYTWFALGSFARREAYPDSDQDNALAWNGPPGDPDQRAWMSALAERVVGGVAAAGIPPCSGGAVASKGLFARPLEDWERVARSWLDDPDQEKALILVNVVVDGRAIWGEDVAAKRMRAAFASARNRPRLLRLLESFALADRPPTGFRHDLVVEHDGEHRGTLDIKKGGLLPIVDIARSAAMAAGVSAASTPARLNAAEAAGTIPADDVAVLRDAFDLVTDLRMQHQVRQLREGRPPDNHIDPGDLTQLVRTYLKDAFRAVARVQKNLARSMHSPFGVE